MTSPNPNKPTDKILEHEYDGIQEYDNPMPRWWLMTFAGTIIFSVIYYFNIGPVGNGKGRIADYEDDMKAFAAAHPAPHAEVTLAELQAVVKDHEAVEHGKETFTTNCVACHGVGGGGIIGPNLTDKYWIHGAALTDIYKTVNEGVLEKGMPAWGKTLKPEQVRNVVAYVTTLQGTSPANPKAPQGVQATP
jgi:cytochrome c oxidase cbb3-type subunit 3